MDILIWKTIILLLIWQPRNQLLLRKLNLCLESLPDGKILSINNRLYNNSGYIPDYNSIQYQSATLISASTTIASNITLSLPQPFNIYQRIILIIEAQNHSDVRTDNVSITVNGVYLNDSNDKVYATSLSRWWLFGIQFNNLFLCTTHRSTSTGLSLSTNTNNYITINTTFNTHYLQTCNVYFGIY